MGAYRNNGQSNFEQHASEVVPGLLYLGNSESSRSTLQDFAQHNVCGIVNAAIVDGFECHHLRPGAVTSQGCRGAGVGLAPHQQQHAPNHMPLRVCSLPSRQLKASQFDIDDAIWSVLEEEIRSLRLEPAAPAASGSAHALHALSQHDQHVLLSSIHQRGDAVPPASLPPARSQKVQLDPRAATDIMGRTSPRGTNALLSHLHPPVARLAHGSHVGEELGSSFEGQPWRLRQGERHSPGQSRLRVASESGAGVGDGQGESGSNGRQPGDTWQSSSPKAKSRRPGGASSVVLLPTIPSLMSVASDIRLPGESEAASESLPSLSAPLGDTLDDDLHALAKDAQEGQPGREGDSSTSNESSGDKQPASTCSDLLLPISRTPPSGTSQDLGELLRQGLGQGDGDGDRDKDTGEVAVSLDPAATPTSPRARSVSSNGDDSKVASPFTAGLPWLMGGGGGGEGVVPPRPSSAAASAPDLEIASEPSDPATDATGLNGLHNPRGGPSLDMVFGDLMTEARPEGAGKVPGAGLLGKLEEHGGHVWGWGPTAPPPPPTHHIEYLTVPIADAVNRNILLHFKRHFEFVEGIRAQRGGAVLVHCAAGVSRSATLVLAYLMRKLRWQYHQAFQFVAQGRPYIRPNNGFVLQLQAYQLHLEGHVTWEQCRQMYQLYLQLWSQQCWGHYLREVYDHAGGEQVVTVHVPGGATWRDADSRRGAAALQPYLSLRTPCNLRLLLNLLVMRAYESYHDRHMLTFVVDVVHVMCLEARKALDEEEAPAQDACVLRGGEQEGGERAGARYARGDSLKERSAMLGENLQTVTSGGAPDLEGRLRFYVSDITALGSRHVPQAAPIPLELTRGAPATPPSSTSDTPPPSRHSSGPPLLLHPATHAAEVVEMLRLYLLDPGQLHDLFRLMWRAFWRYEMREAEGPAPYVERFVQLLEAVLKPALPYLQPGCPEEEEGVAHVVRPLRRMLEDSMPDLEMPPPVQGQEEVARNLQKRN